MWFSVAFTAVCIPDREDRTQDRDRCSTGSEEPSAWNGERNEIKGAAADVKATPISPGYGE